MEERISRLADFLYSYQQEIEKTGYPTKTKSECYNLCKEWVETHSDWTDADLRIGIKNYIYAYPRYVSIDMLRNKSI